MHIGIIVHSQSGTTLGFGERVAAKLRESGHIVDLVVLKTDVPVKMGPPRSAPAFKIVNLPDGHQFDALLVGGPVWAFSASPVIVAGIKALQGIAGKKVMPFVTMGLPFPGMGGRQAIALMSGALAASGATVMPGTIITKLFHNPGKLMDEAAARIPSLFA